MLEETSFFDRAAEPLPPPSPLPPELKDTVTVCLHPWHVTMEAVEPGRRPATRQKTASACSDSLAIISAFTLAEHAYHAMPFCQALPLREYRNALTLFSDCALLEGDHLAAANAMNQIRQIDRIPIEPSAVDLFPLVCNETTLQWTGEASERGPEGAATFWQRHRAELYSARIQRVVGESVDRARVTGTLRKRSDGDGPQEAARFEQVWRRESGKDFRLCEMRVE